MTCMHALSNNPVYDICLSYQKTAAMAAAVKLNIFTVIGSSRLEAGHIAERTGCSTRGVRILCDFLCVIGLLEKNNGLYFLPDAAARFLDRSSPDCMADIIDFFGAPATLSMVMDDPALYVRSGGAAGVSHVSPDNPVWIAFAQAMVPFAAVEAKRTAAYITKKALQPRTVLDVAAGHGLFGIEVAKLRMEASVTAIDWPGVLEIAKQNAAGEGLSARYSFLSGNAFELDWGCGYDLILLANILHHFDPDDCVRMLQKAHRSLGARGSVFVIEMIPNPDRVSPPEQAAFAFFMLATTPHGDAYTAHEYEAMANRAGLSLADSMRLLPTAQTLMVFSL